MLHPSESNSILKATTTPLRRGRLLIRPATIRVLAFLTLVALVILLSIDNLKRMFQNESILGGDSRMMIQSLCQQHMKQSNSMLDISNQLLLEHQRAPHTANEDHILMDAVIDNDIWKDLPVKGAFYMVIESGDLQRIRSTIRSVEDRFNYQFRYPWILLSNQYLTASFRKYITKLTKSPIFFGKIDAEVWDYPTWVSGSRAEEYIKFFSSSNVKHATSFLFRQRSRYFIPCHIPPCCYTNCPRDTMQDSFFIIHSYKMSNMHGVSSLDHITVVLWISILSRRWRKRTRHWVCIYYVLGKE